ncbi:MAG: hypothetical protein MRY64_03135 [Hyphomonadaceae bacterium]|nr:hypothetical protein [Hyphomonadaceae bacterium]
MISHITLGTTDKARADAFYAPIMDALGLPRRNILALPIAYANADFTRWVVDSCGE